MRKRNHKALRHNRRHRRRRAFEGVVLTLDLSEEEILAQLEPNWFANPETRDDPPVGQEAA